MPPVDLETLVSACAGVSCDNKVTCETLASTTSYHHPAAETTDPDPPELQPDFPPESFRLSKDAEVDWLDRNAFFERKDSGKGNNSNSNSTNLNPNLHSNSTNLNPNLHPNSNSHSHSQRFSNLKSKASIIGLPKTQKAAYVEAKNRRHTKPAGNTRLFPKRSGSTGKPVSSLIEPSSPKVSCMGRVRSRRDRNRQMSKRSTELEGRDNKERKPERSSKKNRFFESFRAVFRGKKPSKDRGRKFESSRGGSYNGNEEWAPVRSKIGDIRDRLPASERDALSRRSGDSGGEPAGLAGMKRFASGRRSIESLGVDVA